MSPKAPCTLKVSPRKKMAREINNLYRALKAKQKVVDIKFAFGTIESEDHEPQKVYGAVKTALKAALENRTTTFDGPTDSYGLRRSRRK